MNEVICHYDYRSLHEDQKTEWAEKWSSSENRDPAVGCAFNQFPTEPVGQRCIPSLSITVNQTLSNIIPGLPELPGMSALQGFLVDLAVQATNAVLDGLTEIRKSVVPLIVTAVLALVMCMVIILLFRIVVGPIIYVSLVGIQVGFVLTALIPILAGCYYLMLYYYGKDITSNWFRTLLPEEERSSVDFRTMQVCESKAMYVEKLDLICFS